MPHQRLAMQPDKHIALVAHDNKKRDLVEWARFNRNLLAHHTIYATGTTGQVLEKELELEITKYRSGPLGGDQQIGAKIVDGQIDFLIFFWDPLDAHPHDPDHGFVRSKQREFLIEGDIALVDQFGSAQGERTGLQDASLEKEQGIRGDQTDADAGPGQEASIAFEHGPATGKIDEPDVRACDEPGAFQRRDERRIDPHRLPAFNIIPLRVLWARSPSEESHVDILSSDIGRPVFATPRRHNARG